MRSKNQIHYVEKSYKAYPDEGIEKGDSYYWWRCSRSKERIKSHHLPTPEEQNQIRNEYLERRRNALRTNKQEG